MNAIPNARDLAAQLVDLIARATDDDLDDRGRYFRETYSDLTQCSHGETGEYSNPRDGRLIEFLWNNRQTILTALQASAGEAGTAATTKIGAVHEHATAESGDAQNIAKDIWGPSQ